MMSDWSWNALRSDLRAAVMLLTRLPSGGRARAETDWARAARLFPLVGALVGLIGAAAFWLADGLGLPPLVSALLAVGAGLWVTGALHEDGLADLADGFGGGRGRDRKLQIMRDSRIGSFGVLALILSVGLRAAALAALAEPGLVAAALVASHAAARAPLALVMATTPLARTDGLAVATGKPSVGHAATALVLGLLLCFLAVGPGSGFWLWLAAIAAAVTLLSLARAQIGGYTGDVLGAIEQVSEAAALLCLVALR